MNYYIQTIVEPQGGYKIHKLGCKNMPMASNRFYLGNFFNAMQAIEAAKKSHYKIVKICSDCIKNSMKH
ncbi:MULTISPECIES: hypothetical protein [Providencia]|uniref:hypothetical protein n=1 Tax=Providencia TaxID=586 RepID=UPI001981B38B|nr:MULTISPECIES: hypothetical protein [Providencia]MBN4863406.1 hypothetical protein [Providencia stuartii]MBN4876335.1 hypothetical protein [Providencia stuartii]MBN4878151.1 hypothetical protein [Providencia stuartii]MBN4881929.1 hypothetical protein [Providencia stuartii]